MFPNFLPLKDRLLRELREAYYVVRIFFTTTLPRAVFLVLLLFVALQDELNLTLHVNGQPAYSYAGFSSASAPPSAAPMAFPPEHTPPPTVDRGVVWKTPAPGSAEAKKRAQQRRYIERFAQIAQTERDKYGIPASITLAQGLLESNAGQSPLATRNRNHFGMKCFSKSCRRGHCSNFTDDSHKDFFRVYDSAWASYRAHSEMLKHNKRYRKLFDLPPDDYRAWARELRRAGYATDPAYAEKLIGFIEGLELWRFDAPPANTNTTD